MTKPRKSELQTRKKYNIQKMNDLIGKYFNINGFSIKAKFHISKSNRATLFRVIQNTSADDFIVFNAVSLNVRGDELDFSHAGAFSLQEAYENLNIFLNHYKKNISFALLPLCGDTRKHWTTLKLIIDKGKVTSAEYYDSTPRVKVPQGVQKILEGIKISRRLLLQQFDGYSCGPHTFDNIIRSAGQKTINRFSIWRTKKRRQQDYIGKQNVKVDSTLSEETTEEGFVSLTQHEVFETEIEKIVSLRKEIKEENKKITKEENGKIYTSNAFQCEDDIAEEEINDFLTITSTDEAEGKGKNKNTEENVDDMMDDFTEMIFSR